MKKWIVAIFGLIGYSLALGALDGQPEITVIEKKIFYRHFSHFIRRHILQRKSIPT